MAGCVPRDRSRSVAPTSRGSPVSWPSRTRARTRAFSTTEAPSRQLNAPFLSRACISSRRSVSCGVRGTDSIGGPSPTASWALANHDWSGPWRRLARSSSRCSPSNHWYSSGTAPEARGTGALAASGGRALGVSTPPSPSLTSAMAGRGEGTTGPCGPAPPLVVVLPPVACLCLCTALACWRSASTRASTWSGVIAP